jgi:two-component system, response regulator, stage 0 sporulation protein F
MAYKILIVDDDREFRSEFRDILEQEYEVAEAANGSEALKAISGPNLMDLVILDVKMPGLRGTEVLREIRNRDTNLSVIMLTAYGTKDVIIESMNYQADYFLEKPHDIAKALDTIRQLLNRKQPRSAAVTTQPVF